MFSTKPKPTQAHLRHMGTRLRQIQTSLRQTLQRALEAFFRAQAARVVSRYTAQKMAEQMRIERKTQPEELLGDDERRRLEAVIIPVLTEAWLQAAGLTGEVLDMSNENLEQDPRLQSYLNQAGAMIQDIHETTLRAIRQTLADGAAAGYSPYQIAHGVPKDDFRGLQAVVTETYSGRSETIARTELAVASQQGAHDRYQEAGVSEVDIMDGPDCGWDGHDDPDLADGSRRTLIEAQATPISHPNCVRVSVPVLDW